MIGDFAQVGESLPAEIHEICDCFDSAWRKAQVQERPALEDYLARVPGPARPVLLRELLRVELEYRTKRGETLAKDEFLRRFPDHSETVEQAWRQQNTGTASVLETFRRRPRFSVPSAYELSAKLPKLKGLAFIKQGGMGAVYKATDRLDRLIAVKVLPPELGEEPEFRKRFHEEAKALARLDHPNIVRIVDYDDCDGLFYFVMEYAEKGNLREKIKKNAGIPYNEAIDIILQVCAGLHFAHEKKVLHRDIKPENILVDAQDQVKIADFGISKLVDPQGTSRFLTDSDRIMGTDGYMAPEQRRAEKDIDCRADIFSLGVVFYELLTGELPEGAFDPPSEKGNSPQWLDDVVRRALRPRRDDRFRDVREMADSIRQRLQAHDNAVDALVSLPVAYQEAHDVDTVPTSSLTLPDLLETLGQGISAEKLGRIMSSFPNVPILDEIVAGLPQPLGEIAAKLKDHLQLPEASNDQCIIPDPGNLREWENKPGQELFVELTGRTDGKVWGIDTYTSDSNLATAAVHAGVLRPGEHGVVHVLILRDTGSYAGSTRNGVTSQSYGSWHGAYQLNRW